MTTDVFHYFHTKRYAHILFFFFNATPTTEIYTLSLHDALPIFPRLRLSSRDCHHGVQQTLPRKPFAQGRPHGDGNRSEEHTSELQSPYDLVCRLLLEKKKHNVKQRHTLPPHGLCSPYYPSSLHR